MSDRRTPDGVRILATPKTLRTTLDFANIRLEVAAPVNKIVRVLAYRRLP